MRRVVASLRDSIAFEAGGADERAVRRKADPAKADIERFLRDWKGVQSVASEPSYVALVGAHMCAAAGLQLSADAPPHSTEALRQLGAFYTARGSRAVLTPEVRESVLAALRDAAAALE